MKSDFAATVAVIFVAGSLAACVSSGISEYARLDAAAARAYSSGRYREAADQWGRAAKVAKAKRNRSEARYREAASLARGGFQAEALATLDELIADDPNGERAARAADDRATMLIRSGAVERGYAALEGAFVAHPDSGLAPGELRAYLDWLGGGGEAKIRAYLDAVIPKLENTELGQFAHYAYAESLEHDGKLEQARERYLLLARKYPYPGGALWDDALFHAADLDSKLGDARAAILHLERMLQARETSYMNGSYERGRYAEARFRIAELYRDVLGDSGRARSTFEQLFREHRTSRLRDDAAWNAALLAFRAGDRDGACRDLKELVDAIPDSRFAPCAKRICPEVEAPGECHEYIVANVAGAH